MDWIRVEDRTFDFEEVLEDNLSIFASEFKRFVSTTSRFSSSSSRSSYDWSSSLSDSPSSDSLKPDFPTKEPIPLCLPLKDSLEMKIS